MANGELHFSMPFFITKFQVRAIDDLCLTAELQKIPLWK